MVKLKHTALKRETETPVVSVIILNYKTKKLTIDCINSLLADQSLSVSAANGKTHQQTSKQLPVNQLSIEIIVVDNASDDDSVSTIQQTFGQTIKLIAAERNLGFGPGNNLGAAQASGTYLFFLNSDTLVKPAAVNELVKFLDRHQDYGLVGPKVLLPDAKTVQPASFGKMPTLNRLITRSYVLRKPKLDIRFLSTDVDWVTGAALMMPHDLFSAIGGFDSRYFMYFEDQDLALTVKKSGLKVAVVHEAEILHLGGKSIKRPQIRWQYYDQSQERFFLKHYGWFKTYLMVLLRLPWKLMRRLS